MFMANIYPFSLRSKTSALPFITSLKYMIFSKKLLDIWIKDTSKLSTSTQNSNDLYLKIRFLGINEFPTNFCAK